MSKDGKQETETLDNFSWDSWGDTGGDMFEPAVEEKDTTPEEETKVEDVSTEEEKEVEETQDISFKEEDFELEDEAVEEVGETSLLSKLRDDNVFAVLSDEEEFKDFTDADIPDVLDKEVEARVEEVFEDFFAEMDDDAKAFLKFKREGGNTADFFKVYNQASSAPIGGDLDDESYQEQVVRYGLQLEGMDAEDIEDRVQWLKEGAKLKTHANKYEKKIEKANADQQAKIIEVQKQTSQQQKKQREDLHNTLKTKLEEVDAIGDFTFSKKEKRNLHGYMTKPRVRVGKNNYLTQMQSDLQKAFQDPEKILVLAKLLNNDFDISDLAVKAETKVTKKIKENIERKSNTMKSSNSSTKKGKRALHEYF